VGVERVGMGLKFLVGVGNRVEKCEWILKKDNDCAASCIT